MTTKAINGKLKYRITLHKYGGYTLYLMAKNEAGRWVKDTVVPFDKDNNIINDIIGDNKRAFNHIRNVVLESFFFRYFGVEPAQRYCKYFELG